MSDKIARKRARDSSVPQSSAAEDKVIPPPHPAGEVRHNGPVQVLRMLLLLTYFLGSSVCIVATQLLGAPLYLINRDLYYAYMALTKQSFGLLLTTGTKWWAPTIVRISGDADVSRQMRKTADGRVECNFADRVVLFANHQIYSDWLYLWWMAYTNKMHGHIYIILKESLKFLPILGQGMMFYGFVFMSRKFETDKPRLAHRLQKLNARHSGPLSGSKGLDPMWLLIFPEGTNLSVNTRGISARWAEKQRIPEMRHQLLPRSTGSFFCLNQLRDTVEWVYDCTLAYEGVSRDRTPDQFFTLRSTFLQGRPPKSVNMYWRRFAMSSIPLDDPEAFDLWIRERWTEKDAMLEQYVSTGRFPAHELPSKGGGTLNNAPGGFIETEVRTEHWWEILQIFSVLASCGLLANLGAKIWNLAFYGSLTG